MGTALTLLLKKQILWAKRNLEPTKINDLRSDDVDRIDDNLFGNFKTT